VCRNKGLNTSHNTHLDLPATQCTRVGFPDLAASSARSKDHSEGLAPNKLQQNILSSQLREGDTWSVTHKTRCYRRDVFSLDHEAHASNQGEVSEWKRPRGAEKQSQP
jgi:hypothetical protein